jgi:hypothetical protein
MSLYQQMFGTLLPPLGLPGLQGGVMNSMGLPPFPSLMSLQGAQPIAPVASQPAAPVAAQPEMGSSVPEDSFSRARRIIRETMASAPQEIDPDIAALLQRREERLAQQEAQAEERARPNAWRELVRIGTAMMGTQSPQFGQGLAQGLMATVEEQQKRRDELARQRAAIEQAREGVELQRIEQRGTGRKRAQEELKATVDLAGALGQADLREAQAVLAQNQAELAAMKADPRFTALDIQIKERQVAEINSRITENLAQARAAGQRGAGGGGRGRAGSDVEGRADRTELDKAAARYNVAREKYNRALRGAGGLASDVPQELKDALDDETANLATLNRAFYERYGTSRYGIGLQGQSRAAAATVAAPSGSGWSATRIGG